MTVARDAGVFRRAFFNQYNLILLAGTGLFSATTSSWLPLLLGAGAEVLWLVLGADSPPFRRWAARQQEREQREAAEQRARAVATQLAAPYAERFEELSQLAASIEAQARANPSLEARLIGPELAKLVHLRHAFADMAALHQRLSGLLEENDARELRRDIADVERALATEHDPDVAAGLRQNLDLAAKRLRQDQRIRATHRLLGVKMDTLEKSFRYLQANVVGIGRREELSSELDEIILGVESLEEMQREVDSLGPSPVMTLRAARSSRQADG
ncbi:MAG: hypothetical protein A2V77_16885 [Anaeromyxobacter sp. RBG_16_69_14]|nr:MAG: hypothetical protein A2V77_16885 [Anaeromyxobacter sp. RBG_16_69_14]